ncbi:unnamed protein product [Staurois parvus]|uniref:Uncharacterized protein n=1 Tax=Staurois parvus TaxID=386267 RepID=A0ABN9E584_9NEOB|nr:unnamed protein product [Staurois parvus]
MQSPGRPDIVNAGSRQTRYSECRVWGLVTLYAGSATYIVNAGSWEIRYSECRVRRDKI